MTTLQNRPNTALLVVDVQVGVVAEAYARTTVVANIVGLIDRARREGVPVIWVQHGDDELAAGSDAWRIVPELAPDPAEPLIPKAYGDAFEATDLESVLAGLGVGRLIVVGAETDACIRFHPARCLHPGLRRHPGGRRPHHRRPDAVGRAAARAGDRAHQPLLALSGRARPHGRHGRERPGRFRPAGLGPPRRRVSASWIQARMTRITRMRPVASTVAHTGRHPCKSVSSVVQDNCA